MSTPLPQKSTPVGVVERIEPVLPCGRKLGLAPTVEAPSRAAVARAVAGEKLALPFRTTFYGAQELAYGDRAGNIVVFAERPADAPAQ